MPRRARTLIYCLLLTLLAAAVYFPFLGLHPVSGDEPQYALCTDYIHQTHDWLSPTPYPPDPYFQKPPLYMWLSAATYNLFGKSFIKYRFWSALFGTLTIPGTCYLGALLLSPEVGLLAALLLLSNDDYARNHGVLTGTFDTGLTLACLACFVLYFHWTRGRLRWPAWIAIGVIAGLATLFKPAFGLLPIALLATHAIAFDRRHSLRARIALPAIALGLAFLVCSWWYFIQLHRFGSRYTAALQDTTVHRITQGLSPHHVKAATYYPIRIAQSSIAFLLSTPAVLYILIRALRRGVRRSSYLFIALFTIGWLLLFTVSVSKFLHYAFPVFPLIALSIAAMLIAVVRWLLTLVPSGSPRAAAVYALVPLLLLADAAEMSVGVFSDTRRFFGPWSVTQLFLPAVESGRANVVLYHFPKRQSEWQGRFGLEAKEHFYMMHLPGVQHLDSESDLAKALEKPTLLLLSRYEDIAPLREQFHLTQRSDARFALGSEALDAYAIDFDKILTPHVTPPQSDATITVDPPTPGVIHLRITPAIHADLRVRLTAQIHSPPHLPFTPIINGHHLDPAHTYPIPSGHLITFDIDAKDVTDNNDITIQFDSPQQITLTDAAVDLFPRAIKRR